MSLKDSIKDFWGKNPCGARDVENVLEGSRDFFEIVDRQRYSGDDFMRDVVQFHRWKGKKVCEVGCGMGTDLFQFARHGALVYGVDLTEAGVRLSRKRLALFGCQGSVLVGDAECLPFPDNYFDLVYCWGVIHHTPAPEGAAREIVRVCKPGGSVLVMVYHRRSLVALQAWLYYGLLRGKPGRSAASIIAEHLESPGTRVFTREEAAGLFNGLREVQVQTILTRYDLGSGGAGSYPAG